MGCIPLWYPTHSTAYLCGRDRQVHSAPCRASAPTRVLSRYQPGANRYNNPFSDEIALFETAEGGTSRMLMCQGIHGKVEETGRVFGEKGWMDGLEYHGAMKELPNISRPPLPPGVQPGGHGGSHGPLMNEFVLSILEDRKPLVDIVQA